MRITFWLMCLALAALVLPAGADGLASPRKRPQASLPQRVPGLSDAELEGVIRQRLARSKINSDGFKVRVQGGTATLEGQTDVMQHKGVATRLARASGAAHVVNRIKLSDAARQKAAANLSKGRRRAQIKRGGDRSAR